MGTEAVHDRLEAGARHLAALSQTRTWGDFANGLESVCEELGALVDEIDEGHSAEEPLPWVAEGEGRA